ncbi:phage holin family protein [Vulcaniibacterium gelatinicum]|uniref:phage holin family protein n=1 Tax=Vulcaniibacterium gelatinicum TaxID=2598725 RepID=UPI0011C9723B|nr:phage holin family protein [Vulcaniibacterium gelatinicum]
MAHRNGDPGPAPEAAPDFAESLRQVGAAGRASAGAAQDALKALRALVAADLALARSAFGRSLACTGLAIAFGGSAWLLLVTALMAWLAQDLGWPWSRALLLAAGLSLVVTGLAAWRAVRYFDHTRLAATRRQLARLGRGEPEPAAEPASASAAAPDTDSTPPP